MKKPFIFEILNYFSIYFSCVSRVVCNNLSFVIIYTIHTCCICK
uniref:Uncharacterized protein n=1 Tax=Anguilla anguilla TaxID=7936 RepID=A0A0E9SJM1_ANGAN